MKLLQTERNLVAAAAIGAVLALPAGAQAVETTSLVTGTVATELSLAVAAPAAMSFSHAAPATTSSVITVTSTQVAWTLSVSDNNAAANSGKMLKTAGTGVATLGAPLANALQWAPDGTTFSSLSGTAATVGTGTLVGTKTVTWRQALGATENVTTGDVYSLTAKYTVL